MKAVQIDRYGGPEVLRLREMADPVVAANEVVVDIHAASLNFGDIKVRKGRRPGYVNLTGFPQTLGRDFSGVVRSFGPGMADLKPGDSVFGVLDSVRGTPLPRRFRSMAPSLHASRRRCPTSRRWQSR